MRYVPRLNRAALLLAAFMVAGSIHPAMGQDPPVDALLLGQWDEYDGVYSDLWSDGTYAYFGNWASGDGQTARMFIVDISDVTHPTLVSTFFFPSPNQFSSPQEIMVVDGIAYVALEADGNDGVAIVDVRDPANPSLLATTRLSGYDDTHNVFFADGFLYMCDSQTERVGILDLRDFDPDNPPPSPITQATWIVDNIGSSFVHEIAVVNGRLYCAGWNDGVHVFDITNVANEPPVFLGSVDGSSTHSMWVTDDGKYVVTGEERTNGGIKVYRVTENGDGTISFTLTDSLIKAADAYSVHNQNIVGYRLYNSWYQAGVQVYDINPVTGKLQFRSSFDTSVFENNGTYAGCWGIFAFLGDDRILATDMQNGLHIIATKQDDCTPTDDCNSNGASDFCDLIEGDSADCNHTLVPDECELADGSSSDCQPNGVPDECEADCNANDVADDCDIAAGTSLDCQPNGVPDECEIDCNSNTVPDDCDISGGDSSDCQPNGIPDECDAAVEPAAELIASQLPDQVNGTIADADDSTQYNPTSAAEDFSIAFPKDFTTIKLWGIYVIGDTPTTDRFTVRIHTSDGTFPDTLVYSESLVASTRTKTGLVLFGFFDEYVITLTLAQSVHLEAGDYFIEMYNDTDGDSDTFAWETAASGADSRYLTSTGVPGNVWVEVPLVDLAFEIIGGSIGGDCNHNGSPDDCDLGDGGSVDANANSIPDECEGCDGDANGDNVVDPLDSGFVLARLGCSVGTGDAACNIADQNLDGLVDPLDVGYVLSRFGACE